MSPGLLSNALFRRDFPLGVDKRMCAAYCPPATARSLLPRSLLPG